MGKLADAQAAAMQWALQETFQMMTELAEQGRNGLALGIMRIEIIIDLTEPVRPNPPKTVDRYTGHFTDILASAHGRITREDLKYYSWEGTVTPTRFRDSGNPTDEIISDMLKYYPDPPMGGEELGMTKSTYEIKEGMYHGMVEATENGISTTYAMENTAKANEETGLIDGESYKVSWTEKVFSSRWVYVSEIRANVDVGYMFTNQSRSNRVPDYDPQGYYVISLGRYGDFDDLFYFIPYIDDDGTPRLTGLMNMVPFYGPDFYIEIGFEVEMIGKGGPPTEKEEPPIKPTTTGGGGHGPGGDDGPGGGGGPGGGPPIDPRPPVKPPKRPSSTSEHTVQGVYIPGEYEGTATLVKVEGNTFGYYGVDYNSPENLGGFSIPHKPEYGGQQEVDYEYYFALNTFLFNRCGLGSVRPTTLDLQRRIDPSVLIMEETMLNGIPGGTFDREAAFSSSGGFSAYPGLGPLPKKYLPDHSLVDSEGEVFDGFLIREQTYEMSGYTLEGMTLVANDDFLVEELDQPYYIGSRRFESTWPIYEEYTLELTAVIKGDRLVLEGTLRWNHSSCAFDLIYDVYLVRKEEGIPYVKYTY
jgi:hypothetical protein